MDGLQHVRTLQRVKVAHITFNWRLRDAFGSGHTLWPFPFRHTTRIYLGSAPRPHKLAVSTALPP